ncbi:helix-turn-helix domain-containing protein [Streptosporangium canum]|uniref:helix-turn-helix domain-containing protein n=1 Tax=Streptosporangium canum TaxID=324952 RepID=UPI0034174328
MSLDLTGATLIDFDLDGGHVVDAAYDAIRRGELPAIRVGRAIRIPTAKLADLLGLPHHATTATSDTTEATS